MLIIILSPFLPFLLFFFFFFLMIRRPPRSTLLSLHDALPISIIGSHVIELGSRLVVPTAPGSAAVDGNHRALIARQRDSLRVLTADPDALIIIASGSEIGRAHV